MKKKGECAPVKEMKKGGEDQEDNHLHWWSFSWRCSESVEGSNSGQHGHDMGNPRNVAAVLRAKVRESRRRE
jgi:hypothetical protein